MNNNRQVSVPRFKALLDLPMRKMSDPLGIALAIFLILMLSAAPNFAAAASDPLESVNRGTHKFNRIVDSLVLKPIARSYEVLTPEIAKQGVSNFFSNLDDIRVTLNDLAQFKFRQAASDLGRFTVNSTVGIGGLFNVAGPVLGLEKHHEDFGQTLDYWNVGAGPYVVLPLFGPSTARDSIGLIVDSLVNPIPNLSHVETRIGLAGTEVVNKRAAVLSFDDFIVGDDYLFIRDLYIQRRDYLNEDGSMAVAFEEF